MARPVVSTMKVVGCLRSHRSTTMKTKLMITGMSVSILALATPVYAGHLGGGFGGGLGGTIGSGFGAGGGFASHGGLNDSLDATDARAVRQSADKTKQSADKAKAKTGTAAQAVGGATDSTNANVGNVAAGAESNAQGEAAKSAAAPATAKSSAAPAPTKPASTTAASTSRSKPAASTNVTGASDETLHAGGRDVSGSGTGSVGADHSPGSNSVEASATTSGSQH